MIAANDAPIPELVNMAPDQLRVLIAHASGLHAHACGNASTAEVLRRVADRIDPPPRVA